MISIEKGNKLIAEYLEWDEAEQLEDGYCAFNESTDQRLLSEMEFHKSWEWLMPVIAKIEKIEGVYDIEEFLLIRDELCTGRIRTTYEAVVDFIEWYNENKEK